MSDDDGKDRDEIDDEDDLDEDEIDDEDDLDEDELDDEDDLDEDELDDEDDLDEGEIDDEDDLDEGEVDDEDDEDDPRGEGIRRIHMPARPGEEGRRGPRRPRRLTVILLTGLVGLGVAYLVNGTMNVQAREDVIERCLAEDSRLETAIAQRSELRLPISDWMVVLYHARRRYVTELCQDTIDELDWWRWNLGRSIEADVGRASAQEISEALEQAAATCEEEVRALQSGLEERIAQGEPNPALSARIREVSRGQLEACAELRRAVMNSRPGFWPRLEAESVSEVADALEELMPDVPEETITPGTIDG